jgi:hypothetical protein
VAVEPLDGRRSRRLVRELDEAEAARPPGSAIGREDDFHDLAGFGEQSLELVGRSGVVEVSDKEFG